MITGRKKYSSAKVTNGLKILTQSFLACDGKFSDSKIKGKYRKIAINIITLSK
jgi:hypothetical protein